MPALAVVFALGWVPLFVFRAEGVGASLPLYNPNERLWVRLSHVLFSVHATAACTIVSFAGAAPSWAVVASLVVFGAAIGLWMWGRALIGPLRTRRRPDEPPLQLRRDGAFGIVRHPLYLSYLLISAAPLLVSPYPLLLVTWSLCVIAIAVRTGQEERRLKEQIGPGYEAYCRQVKRLIPFVW